jgi:hypothetical protein
MQYRKGSWRGEVTYPVSDTLENRVALPRIAHVPSWYTIVFNAAFIL